MTILIWGFWNRWGNITEALYNLQKAEAPNIKIIHATPRSAQAIIKQIDLIKPDYVLGLGYYRRDATHVRQEQVFHNRMGQKVLDPLGQGSLTATWVLSLPDSKLGNNAGNSNCNRLSYLISQHLLAYPQSKFAFLHVPRSFTVERVEQILSVILVEVGETSRSEAN